jgi:hypothetical protein
MITALENATDFAAEETKLLGKAAIVKIAGQDAASGKVLANDGATGDVDPRDAFCEALASHMTATGETDPVKAKNSLKKKSPNLFEALGSRDAAAATNK